MLLVRYLVLPHVNEWRPMIEQRLSSALGSSVTIGDIVANWSGLNPTLSVQNLNIRNAQGDALLYIPKADALVSWRSLLALDLRLKHLDVRGIDLTVARQVDGNVLVAGYLIDMQGTQTFKLDHDTLAMRWLLGQGEIVINDATIRWKDAKRDAPELTLTQVDFALTNGLFNHRFLVRGSAPEQVARSFEFIFRSDHLLGRMGAHAGRQAEMYVELQDLQPVGLKPWLDVPEMTGRFAGRAWVDVQQGKLANTVLEITGSKIGTPVFAPSVEAVFAQEAQVRLTGLFGDFLPTLHSDLFAISADSAPGVNVQASARGAVLESTTFAPTNVVVDTLNLGMQIKYSPVRVTAHISQFSVANPDVEINLQGDWHSGGASAAGVADLQGSIVRLRASELYRYLTVQTNQQSRDWLRDSIIQGTFNQVAVTLQGDLAEFPFNLPHEKGIFKLDGLYQNLNLAYSSTEKGKGWPTIAYTDGSIVINQLGLHMHSAVGTLLGAQGERLAFKDLKVNIPDMALNPLLAVDLTLQTEANGLLSALRGTPVVETTGTLLTELSSSHVWTVPLAIRADLNDMEKLQVKGEVAFSGSNLAWADIPTGLENIQGSMLFSNKQIAFDKTTATFLGESISIQGSLGDTTAKGIVVEGTLPVATLSKFNPSPVWSALEGQARMRALIIQNTRDGLDVTINSSLEGLAIGLPAPLGKTKEATVPLNLKWMTSKQRNGLRQSVSFTLGDLINGRFERVPATRTPSFFTQAAVSMGGLAQLPTSGMTVDLRLAEVSWADWKALIEKLNSEKSAAAKRTDTVMPRIQKITLQTPQLIYDDFVFTKLNVLTTQVEKGKWEVKLDSNETVGNISWQESSGALAGRVVAKFTRLAVGTPLNDPKETPKIEHLDESQWSDIPGVDLTIDDFTLFGSRLGNFKLLGANIERGTTWNIENLQVKNPHSTLNASGQWRLQGPTRGLKLNVDLGIDDLGKLSTYMGYPDKVRNGSGTLKGEIDWVNFPWVFSYAGMNGQVEIDLKDGIFEHINSRSARLLELLSLQSLQRILSFNFRPGNEFQNGFPWQSIVGKFLIKQGVTQSDDMTITSPVATILLTGDSDLDRKTWNMNADVKPKFDMSGTALATGFVVNPLVGVSALVTQFLLRNPIERAMTVKYHVRGPWDDPTLIPLDVPAPRQQGLTQHPGPGN